MKRALTFALTISFLAAFAMASMQSGKVLAAYEGNRIAQFQIGEAFEKGLHGLPESKILAWRWYTLAGQNGHKMTKEALERLLKIMSEEEAEMARSQLRPPDPDGTTWDDALDGDLDGYLLISGGFDVDGAYLLRNYDNDIPHDGALPLRRH